MVNMLYPGFYPGKKPMRDMRPVGKPYEHKPGFMSDLFAKGEYLGRQANLPEWIPGWIISEEQKAIEAAFTVSSDAKAPEAEILFGIEDVEELPGGTVKISPKKLKEDFWGGLKKALVDDAFASITDPDELRALARADMWREEIKGEKQRFGRSYELNFDVDSALEKPVLEEYFRNNPDVLIPQTAKEKEDGAQKLRVKRAKELFKTPAVGGVRAQLELNAQAQGFKDQASRRVLGQNYGDLGKNVLTFQKGSAATSKRNKNYTAFAKNQNNALASELDVRGARAFAPLAAVDTEKVGLVTLQLQSRQRLYESTGNFTKGIGDYNKGIGKGGKNILKPYAPVDAAASVRKLNSIKFSVNASVVAVKGVKDVDSRIEGAAARGVFSADDSFVKSKNSKATRDLRGLSKDLSTFESIFSDNNLFEFNADGKITRIKNAAGVGKALKDANSKLNRETIDKGSLGSFISSSAQDLNSSQALHDVLHMVNPATGDSIMSDASRSALNLGVVVEDTFDVESWADFLTDLSEGKLPTQFVWSRFVKPRIESYTPSYWIKRGKTWALKNTALGKTLQAGLDKYANLLTNIQNKYMKMMLTVGFGGKGFEVLKERLAQALTKAAMVAIDAWTGGVSKAFGKVIRVVVRFVVNKVVNYASDLFNALKSLDFYAFEKLFQPIFKTMVIMLFMLIILISTPMLMIIALLSGLPENDISQASAPVQNPTGSLEIVVEDTP